MRSTKSLCSYGTVLFLLLVSMFALNVVAFGAVEKVIYSFSLPPDPFFPHGGLVADSSGNLYGAASFSSDTSGCCGLDGAVYELSPPPVLGGEWTFTVLYGFQGGDLDGRVPFGTLIFDSVGNLYGTTAGGGPSNKGTVFELSPPTTPGGVWTETVLWFFDPTGRVRGAQRGEAPGGKLVMDPLGNLYGTTSGGGNSVGCCGLVFELVKPRASGKSWEEKVLYEFGSVPNDGKRPGPDLLLRGGVLYGVAPDAGLNGAGTVFQLELQSGHWIETILHNFDRIDGAAPVGGLIADAAGNLYGTTTGAFYYCLHESINCGTVYELSPPTNPGDPWQETTLYTFKGLSDGSSPAGTLWRDKTGSLWGTATAGGVAHPNPQGAVFKLNPPAVSGGAWELVVVHDFIGSRGDASSPVSGLILVNGVFYGTTFYGGSDTLGAVYSITP